MEKWLKTMENQSSVPHESLLTFFSFTVELNEVEIAEQMTWYLFSVYDKIEHTEFFNANWNKKSGEVTLVVWVARAGCGCHRA